MPLETAVLAERAWEKEPLTTLVHFIVATHHAFTRGAVGSLPALASKVLDRHGAAHPETRNVEALVYQLAGDLAPHMQKEEQILFPYIESLEAAAGGGRPAAACFGTVRNPIRMMMAEHEAAVEILRRLRAVTSGYALPSDACDTFRALYAGLQNLESDLRRHIHLENDFLFPRAVRLEESGVPE